MFVKGAHNLKLVGKDGNAFAILGTARAKLKSLGATQDQITEFTIAATSGDYDNLLCVCCEWFNVT
jgi:hypothetical protein